MRSAASPRLCTVKPIDADARRGNGGNSALYSLRTPPMCSISPVRLKLIANRRSFVKKHNADSAVHVLLLLVAGALHWPRNTGHECQTQYPGEPIRSTGR
jgi:hypothetical protein